MQLHTVFFIFFYFLQMVANVALSLMRDLHDKLFLQQGVSCVAF